MSSRLSIFSTNITLEKTIGFLVHGEYNPRVIIRTSIGSECPLHPQIQHVGDFTDGFSKMVKNIEVVRLEEPGQIFEAYYKAYTRTDGKSTLLVEYGDYYNEK